MDKYWREREEAQHAKNITDQAEYDKQIRDIYIRTMNDVQKEIDSFYSRYAEKEGISMSTAKKRVSQVDIDAYARKAKKYVATRDFSKQANAEMRLYNLTMKINRLELLKAEIGLHLVSGFDELEKLYGEKLTDQAMNEFERQAGILGETVNSPEKMANSIVNASFHNATYSQRIWMHQDQLKYDLNKLLSTGLIQGRHPRELARSIRKTFGVSRYNAERLMHTELARVQTDAQLKAYEANGFDMYEFISVGAGACPICKALDGKKFKVRDMLVGENAPPMHPQCRCSTSAAMDTEGYEDWLEAKSNGEFDGSWEEWQKAQKEKAETVENTNAKNTFDLNNKPENVAYVPAKNQQEAVGYLKTRLGYAKVAFKGMSIKSVNEINKALYNIYQEYPQLKGFIKEIKVDNNLDGVAAFSVSSKRQNINTQLILNPNHLADVGAIEELVAGEVKSGYWTSKSGVKGILAHEFGHALEVQRTFEEAGIDPFSQDINTRMARYEAFKAYGRHEIAERELKEAFKNANIPLTENNLEKYISGYAKKSYREKGNYAEAFAEAVSDDKPNAITAYIQSKVRSWRKC